MYGDREITHLTKTVGRGDPRDVTNGLFLQLLKLNRSVKTAPNFCYGEFLNKIFKMKGEAGIRLPCTQSGCKVSRLPLLLQCAPCASPDLVRSGPAHPSSRPLRGAPQ